ncbi:MULTISPECIES: DUF4079 domain-containing protein [Spirulina sp. CCY15215]|uniref:DUF4079 domain-containing protein n=1 Tax=Spirulina sp. CCY15215 TaxID=2767591 RepID=UPI00194E0802|nr:DUF4079 domain-containing protein [Spirulina major]
MDIKLLTALIHPIFAVIWVFPLIGIVSYFAMQTRQRRLQAAAGVKSKIPPAVGLEHVKIGRLMAGSVVMLSLIGFAYATIKGGFIEKKLMEEAPFRGIFLIFIFAFTLISLILLYRAKPKIWRATFATLTSMGLIVIGSQEWIFRRGGEWYISHYYYGLTATIFMVISLAIIPEIYKDRSLAWRRLHITLNTVALFLFMGQGITGMRDLAEIAFYSAK